MHFLTQCDEDSHGDEVIQTEDPDTTFEGDSSIRDISAVFLAASKKQNKTKQTNKKKKKKKNQLMLAYIWTLMNGFGSKLV